jgi:hypothetical protein
LEALSFPDIFHLLLLSSFHSSDAVV